MRLSTSASAVIVFLVLAGCASRNDLDYVSYQVSELQARIPKIEKDMGQLKSETKEGVEKNLQGLKTDLEAMHRNSADLQANMEALKVDMQVVSGKLDDAVIGAKKPANDLALMRDDMERRFTAIEGRLATLEKMQVEQKKAAETPEAIYQSAMDSFKSGDMPKAREILSRFLEKHATHDLAANAHYWLGETYYNEKKFDQAILEFQDVIKNYPGKEKVPAAMLKQAMAFKELGDTKSAKYLYKKLIELFPDSDEAKTSKDKLKALK
jgi:tol-pal system protein YbgF